MVQRETDINLINRIANSPAVRPFIDYRGVAEPMNFAPAVGRVTQTGIVWLSNGNDAVACFALTGEREWQAHLMFAETCRGRDALTVAAAMLDHMAPHADLIWGAGALANRKVLWFARKLGFREIRREVFEAEGPVAIMAKGTVH